MSSANETNILGFWNNAGITDPEYPPVVNAGRFLTPGEVAQLGGTLIDLEFNGDSLVLVPGAPAGAIGTTARNWDSLTAETQKRFINLLAKHF